MPLKLILLLIFVQLSTPKKPMGEFRCAPDHVLVIYDLDLPKGIHMYCEKPDICRKNLQCRPSRFSCRNPSITGLSFLQLIREEKKHAKLKKGCCTYLPKPAKYKQTMCVVFRVTDKRYYKNDIEVDDYKQRRGPRRKNSEDRRKGGSRRRGQQRKDHKGGQRRRGQQTKGPKSSPRRRGKQRKGPKSSPRRRGPQTKDPKGDPRRRGPQTKDPKGAPRRRGPQTKGRRRGQQTKGPKGDPKRRGQQAKGPKGRKNRRPSAAERRKERLKERKQERSDVKVQSFIIKKGPYPKKMMPEQKQRSESRITDFKLAEVIRHQFTRVPVQILIVDDISRIRNGYTVKACYVQCTDDKNGGGGSGGGVSVDHEGTTVDKAENFVRNIPRRKTNHDIPEYDDPITAKLSQRKRMHQRNRRPNRLRRPTANKAPVRKSKDKTINLGTVQFGTLIPDIGSLSCFSSDSRVETKTGSKRMDMVLMGEEVLVGSLKGAVYQPVEIWYHRIPNHLSEFIIIKTVNNRTLSISPNHILPLVDCQKLITDSEYDSLFKKSSKFASRAKPGQCVISVDAQTGSRSCQQISQVWRLHKRGVYSPITAHGSLVVDGILVSCFSSYENHPLLHTVHSFLMKMYKAFECITGFQHVWHSEFIDVPLPLKLLADIANLILPSLTLV